MKKHKNVIITLIGIFLFACTDDDDLPLMPLAFENGILVLNEGVFNNGNASISFIPEDLSNVTNSIFNNINNKLLGDVAQSITFHNNLAYIVINNSQVIEVVNRFTFESVGSVDSGLLNPRYMVIEGNKGYVTNWGDGLNPDDDFVAIINLQSLIVESVISVPEGPEKILNYQGTIYIAHQGGFGENNIISMLDTASNTLAGSITVGDRPNSMHLIGNDLWVLSSGNPDFSGNETAGQLDKINITTHSVETSFFFQETDHPNYLSVEGEELYYFLNGTVYKMNASDSTLPTMGAITNVSFYDMTINDRKLYGVDAKDFTSAGSLEIYDLTDNSLIKSLEVSILPTAVYFNGSSLLQ